MKKILTILILLLTVCLTSCQEEQQMENPTDEIINLLKLEDVKTGKLLNSTHASENDYVEVMVANDTLNSFSIIKIRVVAEDGQFNEYTIDIQKDAFNQTMEFYGIITGVILVVCVIIIVRIKKRKKAVEDYYA